MSTPKDENIGTTNQILEAINDLHAQEQIITREKLGEVLPHLTLSKISDRLGYLIEIGKVSRPERGVYVPVVTHPPSRCICKYLLPDGTIKIEVGDDLIITLTPREARYLGNLMVAEAMQFSNIELGHTISTMQTVVVDQVRKLERKVEKIAMKNKDKQIDIFEGH